MSTTIRPVSAPRLSTLLCLLLAAAFAGFAPVALARDASSPSVDSAPSAPASAYERLPHAQIDLGQMIRDVQQLHYAGNKSYMTFWLPDAFWAKAMSESGHSVSDPATELALTYLKNFIVVIAMRDEAVDKVGTDARYANYRQLAGDIRLIDDQGRKHKPIPANKLDPLMSQMIAAMQPLFAEMAGDLGEGMHVFVFPAKAEDGSRIADAYSDGHLIIAIGDVQNRYRLPLGSLLAPQVDATSGERFPGDFRFNPYTGAALQAAPRQSAPKQSAHD